MTTPVMVRNTEVARLLDELGLAIGTHQVEIVDFKQVESGYVHHTRVPVAVTGYALVSPAFARGRFPKFSFLDIAAKRPSMDETEAQALAAICGAQATPPFWSNRPPFRAHLFDMIDRYDLEAFFVPDEEKGDRQLVRPGGFNYGGDWEANKAALTKWRADYRKLSPERQLMVAAIVRLYNSNEEHWLVGRVPKNWHAAEGITILQSAGALADWARLVALYPGW